MSRQRDTAGRTNAAMDPYPNGGPRVRDAAQPAVKEELLSDGTLVLHDGASTETGRWIEGTPWSVIR
jgi:hypothetical protein